MEFRHPIKCSLHYQAKISQWPKTDSTKLDLSNRLVMANVLVTQSLAKILRLSTFRGNISLNFLMKFGEDLSQASIKCSKSTRETLEQGV